MRSAPVDVVDALTKAWVAVGPTPCEHYGCALQERCGSERLACDAFRMYVFRGRTVNPRAVVRDSKQRGMVVIDLTETIEPTAEMYARIFPRRDTPAHGQAGRHPQVLNLSGVATAGRLPEEAAT